jgi:DNA primase
MARLREAADLMTVVSEHVKLKRQGRRWVGVCPFHQDSDPSFSVNPDRGLFYCFGCHASGDVIDFVMRLERLEFLEAVEQLARRFGVELPRSAEGRRRQQTADRIRTVLDDAQRWFVERLHATEAGAVREQLAQRGFPETTWASFGFGYAPDSWRGLLDGLAPRHRPEALVEAGLAVVPERGGRPYDRFRGRITFPIRSVDGRLVAFGGRALPGVEPKYLNSPEGTVFHKRSTLFMLDQARRQIDTEDTAIVVEGYFDCLSLHRAGISNAVATLGTALTEQHAAKLRRAGRVVLCYDADPAGRRAAETAARVLLAAERRDTATTVEVMVLPAGEDPDDVVRAGGAKAFRAHLDTAMPLIDFLLADAPTDRAARRQRGAELAAAVAVAGNPVHRQQLLEELARRLDLPFQVVEEAALQTGSRSQSAAREPATAASATRPLPAGEQQLARLLLEGSASTRARLLAGVVEAQLTDDRTRTLVAAIRAICEHLQPETEELLAELTRDQPEPLRQLVSELLNCDGPAVSEDSVGSLLRDVLLRQSSEELRALQRQIDAAERSGEEDRVRELLTTKQQIARERARIRTGTHELLTLEHRPKGCQNLEGDPH